jgi:hypothetical protein
MSYLHAAAQNAAINTAIGLGGLASNATGTVTTGMVNMGGAMTSYPMMNESNHIFSCNKVENGWTFTYRNKTHIASTVDEMMEQMKAAMVIERIEK